VLNGEETLATISTTIAYRLPTADFHVLEFKGGCSFGPRGAHLLLLQLRMRPQQPCSRRCASRSSEVLWTSALAWVNASECS